MTRIMYDNTVAHGIPAEADMVAGYIDGEFAWTASEWDVFPRAAHVTIATSASTNAGDVLDVEKYDATPPQAGPWIARRKQAGLYRPTIYCDRVNIPAVRAGTGDYVLGEDYDIWVADWTGAPHTVIAPGPGELVACSAVQYLNTSGYDLSVVFDDQWPHRSVPVPTMPQALAALQVLADYIG
jgi:hypothetical protein